VGGARRLAEAGLQNRDWVAVWPGSGSQGKNWSPANFAAVASTLREEGVVPVFFQGPADRPAVAEALALMRPPAPPLLTGDSPQVLSGLFERCRFFLGNDSGPTHLAALIGRPTVAVFGPTDPARCAPRGAQVAVLRGDLPCAPCAEEQMHDCAERECLLRVTPAEVLEAARRFL
jgi:ADP-heptose:LPS heptosyltransferase